MMAGEEDLGLGEELQRLVDVAAPAQRIADLRAPQGVEVVHVAGDDFGTTQRLPIGEVEHELRRRLGARGVLEHHLDTIDGQLFDVVLDDHVGRNKSQVTRGDVLAYRLIDMTKRTARQQYAVLKEQTPAHRVTGIDVF